MFVHLNSYATAVLTTLLLVSCSAENVPTAAEPANKSASSGATQGATQTTPQGTPKAALTVATVQPKSEQWPLSLPANGSVAAWQEASVGAETQGLKLAEVRVNVGDSVRRGQVLAVFATDTLSADLAEMRAGVVEAEAVLAEARAEVKRALELKAAGFVSEQKVTQATAAERSAHARLEARRAQWQASELRLGQARVLAPDSGVVSARSATVGAVTASGQELFRLIRQGRLEWRAEVASADLARISPGMSVNLTLPGGATGDVTISGKVRTLAPVVDQQTRNGLVYVDLPKHAQARAGMFARGEFLTGASQGLTLPQSAVLLRDGFSYVFLVEPGKAGTGLAKVMLTKVSTGRRVGERIAITAGLQSNAHVVAKGGAFLADGDTVRVVAAQ